MGKENGSGTKGWEFDGCGPRYDAGNHTFFFDGKVIETFNSEAPKLEWLLEQCEEHGWKFPITYAQLGARTEAQNEMVKNAAKGLNGVRGRKPLPIRFYITKRGELFCEPR